MNGKNRAERKLSYMEAVVGDTTEKQVKLKSFQNTSSSSDRGDPEFVNANPACEKAIDPPTESGSDIEQEPSSHPRKQPWRDFSEYSSLHGLRFVFIRRSFWARLLWLCLLLTCSSYVIYSLCYSIIKYFDYPIATIMKIQYPDDGMPFPAVTICPITTLSKRKVSMIDDDPKFNKLGLNIDACKVTAAVRGGRPCGEALLCCCYNNDILDVEEVVDNCTADYKNELLGVIKRNKGSYNEREFLKAYGPDLRRMIIPNTCRFGSSDKGCSYKDFKLSVTEYGICYSFNSVPGEKVLNVYYGDVSAGLFLMLDIRANDHMFGLLSEGVKVLVHNQGEFINPWNGLLVAPGSHAQISVTRKVYQNKKKPYETDCDDSRMLANFQTYTSDGCYYECLSNKMFAACKCRAVSDTANSAVRICFRDDRSCTDNVLNDVFKGTKTCDCPLACNVIRYEPTVSTAAFPNPSMTKILQRKGFNQTEDYFRKMEWKTECDLLLLEEIVVSEPYQYKSSTRERGKIWEDITERLNANDAFKNRLGNKRAVRDRYTLLAKKFKKRMAEEERASGVSPEMSEQDKLLEQIIERFEESDREADENAQQGDKNKENDRKKAEEMRKRSMEKLGETRKRQAEEGGKVTPRKRGSGSETLVYLREKAEREFDLRKEELEVKKDEQSAQLQMFQFMQQQLQQQQQQQQVQLQQQQQQQQLQNQLLMALIEKINK